MVGIIPIFYFCFYLVISEILVSMVAAIGYSHSHFSTPISEILVSTVDPSSSHAPRLLSLISEILVSMVGFYVLGVHG